MLFFIDRSVSIELSKRKMSPTEEIFFSSLANSYCRGECYLCGSIDSLDILSNLFSTSSNNVYNSVKARFAEAGSAISAVNTVIVLYYPDGFHEDTLPEVITQRPNRYDIPVPIALSLSLEKKCCLLTENLDDCRFYDLISQYYCLNHAVNGLRTCLHHENGGGNTTDRVLHKCVVEDRVLTLCIVDSDRKWGASEDYPNQPAKGETCQRVIAESEKLRDRRDVPQHTVHLLDMHEIENLIPRVIMKRIEIEQIPEMRRGLDMLNALISVGRCDAVLCYDYKKGLPYAHEEPRRAYWKEILFSLGGSESDMPPCTKNEAEKESRELYFPPICRNNLLQRAIDALEDTDLSALSIDDYLLEYWDQIGSVVFSWGCSGLPMYA